MWKVWLRRASITTINRILYSDSGAWWWIVQWFGHGGSDMTRPDQTKTRLSYTVGSINGIYSDVHCAFEFVSVLIFRFAWCKKHFARTNSNRALLVLFF